MALTSQLGTADSQLGNIQVGIGAGLNGEPSAAVVVPAGTVALLGLSVITAFTLVLVPTGALALSGAPPTVTRTEFFVLLPAPTAIPLTGRSPTAARSELFLPAPSGLVLTGRTPTSVLSSIFVPAGSVTVTGRVPKAARSEGVISIVDIQSDADYNDGTRTIPFAASDPGDVLVVAIATTNALVNVDLHRAPTDAQGHVYRQYGTQAYHKPDDPFRQFGVLLSVWYAAPLVGGAMSLSTTQPLLNQTTSSRFTVAWLLRGLDPVPADDDAQFEGGTAPTTLTPTTGPGVPPPNSIALTFLGAELSDVYDPPTIVRVTPGWNPLDVDGLTSAMLARGQMFGNPVGGNPAYLALLSAYQLTGAPVTPEWAVSGGNDDDSGDLVVAWVGTFTALARGQIRLPVATLALTGLVPTIATSYQPAPGTLGITGVVTAARGLSQSPLTFQHTATGDPLYVLAIISFWEADPVTTPVRYGGVPMILGRRVKNAASVTSDWWYLLAPPPGTAAVVIPTASNLTTDITAIAVNVQGAITPPFSKTAFGSGPFSSDDRAQAGLTIPSVPSGFVLDLIEQASPYTLVLFLPGAGQTLVTKQSPPPVQAWAGASSWKPGGSSPAMTWTVADQPQWQQLALSFGTFVAEPLTGTSALTGQAPSLLRSEVLLPVPVGIAITGLQPAVVRGEVFIGSVNTLTCVGLAPTLATFYGAVPGTLAIVGAISSSRFTGNFSDPLTFLHTATGDPLFVLLYRQAVNAPPTPPVTFGGVPLTLGQRYRFSDNDVEWWWLAAPTPGTAAIVVPTQQSVSATAVNVQGVTGPPYTQAKALASGSIASSLTAQSTPGKLVLDIIGTYSTPNEVYTPSTGQIPLTNQNAQNVSCSAATSWKTPTDLFPVMSWTLALPVTTNGGAHLALSFETAVVTIPWGGLAGANLPPIQFTGWAPTAERTEKFGFPLVGGLALTGYLPTVGGTQKFILPCELTLSTPVPYLVTSECFVGVGAITVTGRPPFIQPPVSRRDFVNPGFETGDSTGWITGTGDRGAVLNPDLQVDDLLPWGALYFPPFSEGSGAHSSIVTAHQVPQTANQLTVPFAGEYAWRVEDLLSGGYASAISQLVAAYGYPQMFFTWAAVLEAAHGPTDSATIKIRLTDETLGIELLAREYNAASDGTGVDARFRYEASTNFFWTPWQVEAITIPPTSLHHDLRLAILASDCSPRAHAGWLYLDHFGPKRPVIPPIPAFKNAELVTGLAWIIVTLRAGVSRDGGTQFVWSDRPLPDPSTYYLGWKEPRVIKWGRIRRALSDVLDGQYETTDFTVTLDDNDHLLRDLGDGLMNATVAVYMISDEDRRKLKTPTTVYRGVIRNAKPTGVLQYDLTIKDTFAEAFSTTATINLIPRRTIIRDDFANCGQTKVNSSAEGYVVDGAVSGGGGSPDGKRIPVRDGWGCFAAGDQIAIGGHAFRVTNSSTAPPAAAGGDTETWIEVDPAVGGALGDGDAIIQSPTHTVEAAAGKRVPFVYGYITDRHFTEGEDEGDGQGPMIYVGDKVLADGRTYGEFLWSGWACYGGPEGEGKPFRMVYFWNNPLPWGFYFPDMNSLPEEADVDGRVCCPGFGNWTANGFTDSFVDYNGRRYTVLYLRGVFRDWALGITPAPPNMGGVPFDVNAFGAEDVGDGTGALIANLAQQYKHAVLNLCPPKGEGYQSGPWLDSPTFADDPSLSMIDEDSFDAADTQSAVYVDGGFRGDFIIGANNEAISARDLIARFNLSGAWQCGFNNKTQFFIDLVNTDLTTVDLAAGLGWVRDIFSKTFSITPQTKDLYTAIKYLHTQDYCGRTDGGWRSTTANVANPLEIESDGATAYFGSKTTYETLSLYMLRGKNRDGDADDYTQGSATIKAVLALTLARLCAIQHLPALQTGPAGFQYELAGTVPVTHYEGYGSGGWTDEPIRIERTEIDPSEYVTVIEGYQLASMLGIHFDWPITWTPTDPEADPPVVMGPPDPPEEWG